MPDTSHTHKGMTGRLCPSKVIFPMASKRADSPPKQKLESKSRIDSSDIIAAPVHHPPTYPYHMLLSMPHSIYREWKISSAGSTPHRAAGLVSFRLPRAETQTQLFR